MERSIHMMLVFAICLSQSWCGHCASQQTENKAPTALNSPFAQSSNQTKTISGEEHWIRGNLLRDEAKYEEAAKEYQLAIDNGYDSNWVRTELGIVLEHYLHLPEEAARHYRVAIARDEKDWRAHWSLANVLLETKQFAEALKELQIVKRLDPKNTAAGVYIYETAKALDGLERRNEALKEYEAFLQRAKRVEPNSPRVREVRARVEELKGKSGSARRVPRP